MSVKANEGPGNDEWLGKPSGCELSSGGSEDGSEDGAKDVCMTDLVLLLD
jgi:hypothetical protein